MINKDQYNTGPLKDHWRSRQMYERQSIEGNHFEKSASQHQTDFSLMLKFFCSSRACTMDVRKSWSWISLDMPWQPLSSWTCATSWFRVRHNTTTMTVTASHGANVCDSRSQSLTWPMSLMHDAIRELLCEEKGTAVTSPNACLTDLNPRCLASFNCTWGKKILAAKCL